MERDLAAMRETYTMAELDEHDVAPDWLTQFRRWMAEAVAAGLAEPNAMVLSTASEDGVPAGRTVLAKGVDLDGIVFYTNYTSAKSHDVQDNPWAAVTFPWYPLQRQVHLRGRVHKVDDAVTAAYWATRPRDSQLGAWASPQSVVMSGRPELDALLQGMQERFGSGDDPIPVPPHWGGWRIDPVSVEFWQGRRSRMHDRIRYRRVDGAWVIERLAP